MAKEAKFTEGNRVVSECLGAGKVVDAEPMKGFGLVVVKFDNAPPMAYNMAQNPCHVFDHTLVLESEAPNAGTPSDTTALNRRIAEARGFYAEKRGSTFRIRIPYGKYFCTGWYPTSETAWLCHEMPQWASDLAAASELLAELWSAELEPILALSSDGDCAIFICGGGESDPKDIRVPLDGDPLKAAAHVIAQAWLAAHDAGMLANRALPPADAPGAGS